MNRSRYVCVAALALVALGLREAAAQPTTPAETTEVDQKSPSQTEAASCIFEGETLRALRSVNLVAVLHNAPRTKVTLSIDSKHGFHREILWDPAVGDGLKHDLLLPPDLYTVLAYAEEDRVQTSSLVMTKTTQFTSCDDTNTPATTLIAAIERQLTQQGLTAEAKKALLTKRLLLDKRKEEERKRKKAQTRSSKPSAANDEAANDQAAAMHQGCADSRYGQGLLVSTQQTHLYTSTMAGTGQGSGDGSRPVRYDDVPNSWRPKLRLLCEPEGALQIGKVPLATKQLFAASVARGFLDQTAPAVVTDTLAILADIAIERAKSGAMELVKDRFVKPICDDLDLELLGLGNEGERALPRTCALLENMRLQDVLSSGRNVIEAARDDIRLTLVPRIVARMDVPVAAQEIAVLAVDLGNRLIDSGSSDVVGIDLLFAQLDRMFRRSTVASFPDVNTTFVQTTFATLNSMHGSDVYNRLKEEFIREVLQRVLPDDPGAWLSKFARVSEHEKKLATALHLDQVKMCERTNEKETSHYPANRAECINKLLTHFKGLPEWGKNDSFFESVYSVLPPEQLVTMVSSLAVKNLSNYAPFSEWLERYSADSGKVGKLAKKATTALLERSCAVRVTIAVVKWCSGRDSCTASEIGAALDKPETLFGPSKTDPLEDLCWKRDPEGELVRELRLPTIRTPYIELATRALTFLTPPAKGEEHKRVRAMLRWTFDLAKTLDEKRASSVMKLEEVLDLFEKRDYVRAIGQTLALARCSDTLPCSRSKEMKLATEFLGVVASYLQVYEDTKLADPAEAKAARKNAIETLIDSSTDRKERGRDKIVSLGTNVGFTSTWALNAPHEFALRVPLGMSFQYLPRGSEGAGWFWKYWGLHLGLQAADLGQFIRANDDDDITWSSFVAPGIEMGFLWGEPHRMFALTAHGSYVPTLTKDSDPDWRLGVSFSYYVPFFDLN